jgi:hypothetical protein
MSAKTTKARKERVWHPAPSPHSKVWEDKKRNDPKLRAFLAPRFSIQELNSMPR